MTPCLVVVAGGTEAPFNYLGSAQIHPAKATNRLRAHGILPATTRNQNPIIAVVIPPPGTSGVVAQANGVLSIAYIDRAMLPDNPEAYGSVTVLALMSDTTENNVPAGVQEALPQWVTSGGHLVIAGGGVTARLQSPFFTGLLPQRGQPSEDAEIRTSPNGGRAVIGRFGAGHVTALSYDPDMEPPAGHDVTEFYAKLFTVEASTPASVLLHPDINSAIMVHNLQPPNLIMIIIYLLVYLVMLVPVNYFVLKKLDKREMAWITTPVIVLLFTTGAYGIGYATKGHRLVLNQISVVEMSSVQHAAEAVSELLIFSPSRTSYDLDLGDNGLFAGEIARDDNNNYGGYQPPNQTQLSSDFNFVDTAGKLEMRDIGVNMWAFRQLSMVHSVNLQGGFSTNLHLGQTGSAQAAIGTITNNTPFHFAHPRTI